MVVGPHYRGVQQGAPMDRCGLWSLRKAISDDQLKDLFVIFQTFISDDQVSAIIWEVWAEDLYTKWKWAGAGEATADWGFGSNPQIARGRSWSYSGRANWLASQQSGQIQGICRSSQARNTWELDKRKPGERLALQGSYIIRLKHCDMNIQTWPHRWMKWALFR